MKKCYSLLLLFACLITANYSKAQTASALDFDGVNDYVSTSNINIIGASSRTLEFWANINAADVNQLAHLANWGATNTPNNSFGLWMYQGKLYFYGWGSMDYNTGYSILSGWHHYSVTYDGINVNTYVDGVITQNSNIARTLTTPLTPLVIGARTVDHVYPFKGQIDEVRVWNIARTQIQLASAKGCELLGNEAGLVAYYKFNQGIAAGNNPTVTTMQDEIVPANNGTLSNFALTGPTSNWVAPGAVNVLPKAFSSSATQTICSGATTSIGLTSNIVGATFSWTTSASGSITGQSNSTGNSIAQPLTNTGTTNGTVTYTVTPMANGCSGLPISVVVTVAPQPTATASSATQTICGGTAPSIALTSNIPTATFSWTTSVSGSITGQSNSTGNTIAQTLTNNGTTNGTVTYTVTPMANGCSGVPITVVVTVVPLPNLSVSPTSLCPGQSIVANLTGNAPWTVNYTPPSLIPGSMAIAASPFSMPLNTVGNYNITSVTTTAPITCTRTFTTPITVVVNPSAHVYASSMTQTICSGSAPSITLSSNVAGTTFSWTTVTTGSVTGQSNATGNSISQTLYNSGTTNGTVSYTITPSNVCVAEPITVVITVVPSLTATATPATQTICSGTAPSIALSSSVTGATFSWTTSVSGSISGQSNSTGNSIAQTLNNTGTANGTVTYTITSSLNGCNGLPITAVVTVVPLPNLTTASSVCRGQGITLNLTGNAPWSVNYTPPNSVPGVLVVNSSPYNIASLNLGTYTINSVTTNSPITCTHTYPPFVISVHGAPDAIATPATQTICSGTAPSIALSSSIAGTTFSWTTATVGSITGQSNGSGTSINQVLTNNGTTDGTVTYIITPVNGCNGGATTVVITVHPKPTVTASPISQTILTGTSTSINLSSLVGGSTFSWTVSAAPGISGQSNGSGTNISQVLINNGLNNGTVTYTVTPMANGCSGTPITVVVTVTLPPIPARYMNHNSNAADLGKEIIENGELSIFPNPTQGQFIIQNKYDTIANIQLMDAMGRIISKLSVPSGETVNVDISEESTGVYYVKILIKSNVIVKKIVKI